VPWGVPRTLWVRVSWVGVLCGLKVERRTAPCAHVGEGTLFGFGRLVGSWHWHVGRCVDWSFWYV
jgi:hypothetical protein